MDFCEAGLDAYAGDRQRWAENMKKVLDEDGSNPYYAWFAAGMTGKPQP
jgi:spermidine synthase